METRRHQPNPEQIAQRSEIDPFGRALKCTIESPIPIPFKLYSTEFESQPVEEEQNPYKATSNIYRPPTVSSSVYRLKEIPVRVTNIPLDINQDSFLKLLLKNCDKLFNRCNVIYDKETRVSRGFAYVSCDSIEKARELAKILRSIVIDGFALSAEVIVD